MRNSDLVVRVGAGLELMAVLFNLLVAFMWFITMIWVLVGLLWAVVGLVALVEGGLAVFTMVKGSSPVAFVGPILGLGVSLFNFNVMGGGLEVFVLVLMIVGMVLRGQEDAAVAA